MDDGSTDVALFDLWEQIVSERGDEPFIHVSRVQETRVQKYTFSTFFKRAQRHAVALQTVLKLDPGDKIALCVDDLSEFALLVHGALIANCVLIPISRRAKPEELKAILKASKPKVFVFPPSFSASVASLIVSAPSVKHWIVTGRNTDGDGASQTGESKIIRRLENVLMSVAGEALQREQGASGKSCGVVFAPDGKFLSAANSVFFSRRQLLQKAEIAAQVLGPCATSKGSMWTSASEFSPSGFLFNFFVSLFLPQPILVRPGFDDRDFWRQILADDVRLAVLNVEELEILEKRGKQRDWRKPDDFRVLVSDQARLDEMVLSQFGERFRTSVGVAFFSFKLAEYISVRYPDDSDLKCIRGESGESLPSYGRLLGQAEVKPKALPGLSASSRYQWGDLWVQSATGGEPVETGIRCAVIDDDTARHLYIVGRQKYLIVRRGKLINLERVNTILAQMQGVVYGKAVSFEHDGFGEDFSVYVIPHRLAKMNKYDVELFLAEQLKREELPSAVILEEKVGITPPSGENELRVRVFG